MQLFLKTQLGNDQIPPVEIWHAVSILHVITNYLVCSCLNDIGY